MGAKAIKLGSWDKYTAYCRSMPVSLSRIIHHSPDLVIVVVVVVSVFCCAVCYVSFCVLPKGVLHSSLM